MGEIRSRSELNVQNKVTRLEFTEVISPLRIRGGEVETHSLNFGDDVAVIRFHVHQTNILINIEKLLFNLNISTF